jgi:hypothetical protein
MKHQNHLSRLYGTVRNGFGKGTNERQGFVASILGQNLWICVFVYCMALCSCTASSCENTSHPSSYDQKTDPRSDKEHASPRPENGVIKFETK